MHWTLNHVLDVLLGTPTWAWAILCLLLFVGINSLRTRVIYLPRLVVVPLILLAIKFDALDTLSTAAFYLLAFVLGSVPGWWSTRHMGVRPVREDFAMEIPGSPVTLVTLLIFFGVHWTCGYLRALHPEHAAELIFIETISSGFVTGFTAVRSAHLICEYYREEP